VRDGFMVFDHVIGPVKPVTLLLRFWPVFAGSFVGAVGATWFCKRVALKYGIVDKPDDLVKTHKEPVAYLGGLGMLFGFTVGMLAAIGVLRDEVLFSPMLKWILAICAGGTIACFVGLCDDLFDIRPWQKILGQIAAAAVILLAGIVPNLDEATRPLGFQIPGGLNELLQVGVVIFFVLGATNSLNLLDGLDGLCAGVTGIITVAMLLLAVHLASWGFSEVGDPVRVIVCLGLVGGVCGFLPFNRHPAKIFMGDAGSMFLGFVMAALMILFAEQIPRWWMASIVVFGLPILDTAVALVRRLINRRPLFVSDRGHIYDQMIDRGVPLKKTVGFCYGLAALYALIGVVMSQIRTRYSAVVYIAVFVISALVVWRKGYLKMAGLRGAIRKQNE